MAEHPTTLLEPKLNFDVALLAHNQARFCTCWLAAQHEGGESVTSDLIGKSSSKC
jgi:hypothetical protein